MSDYLVTYDFKSGDRAQWKEFALQAEAEGLLYVFQGKSDLFRLPNTTLWGPFATVDDAKGAFDRALAATERKIGHKVTLEKRFITTVSGWSVQSDRRKAASSQWSKASKFATCQEHQKNDPYFAY